MRAIWYFDFISPFAYLQWSRVRALSQRVGIEFRPILFAGLLQHHGHKGPAEIPGKREFTYRFVQWQAQREGLTLRFPPAHPFNPIAALRLCVAACCTERAVDAIFAHLWQHGRAGDSAESLREVGRALGIDPVEAALERAEVKTQLRANFDAALADGVFGVPTLRVGDELFWGNDATEMAIEFLADPSLFDGAEYRRIDTLPVGVERRR